MQVSNLYAPEHLILQTQDARTLASTVRNAGSVFIGAYTPESAGDYASGTNHVLPTYGYARETSPNLAVLAHRSVVYRRAITETPRHDAEVILSR